MKVLKIAFLLLIAGSCFTSCQKDCCELGEVIVDPIDSTVVPRGTATLGGIVNCINGEPKEGVTVSITDTDGNSWSETTDVNGQFQLNDMPNVEYNIVFDYTDDDATAYTAAEAQQILTEMRDFILGINADFQLIDALVYDVNDDGRLSTLDHVLFEKRYVEQNPSSTFPTWDWRFIAVEESTVVTSNSFAYPSNLTIQLYQPNATADLEYIALRAGDRHGFACDSDPVTPDPVPMGGVVNCINGDPKEGVTVSITGSDGNSWTEVTDANGEFTLNGMQNVNYTIEFSYSDDDATAYTVTEAQQVVDDMSDVILGVNTNVQLIDELLYDVNENGSVTTLDRYLFKRRYVDKDPDASPVWNWKYVAIDENSAVSSNSISYPSGLTIQNYQPNTTTATLEYIAIRVGDRQGVACDN